MNGLKGTDLFAKVFNRRPELAHTYICHVLPGKVIYILSLKKQNFKSKKIYNLMRKPKLKGHIRILFMQMSMPPFWASR